MKKSHTYTQKSQSWALFYKSVRFSLSVMSDSFWPHGLQHTRPSCPSSTPRACSNSCPLSQWCHPTISSSVIPFPHPQSSPASGSFQMSQLFTSGDQSIGISASISVLPKNIQDWLINKGPLIWKGPWPYSCWCLVAKSHLTLCNPMDCNLPGFSVHGMFRH